MTFSNCLLSIRSPKEERKQQDTDSADSASSSSNHPIVLLQLSPDIGKRASRLQWDVFNVIIKIDSAAKRKPQRKGAPVLPRVHIAKESKRRIPLYRLMARTKNDDRAENRFDRWKLKRYFDGTKWSFADELCCATSRWSSTDKIVTRLCGFQTNDLRSTLHYLPTDSLSRYRVGSASLSIITSLLWRLFCHGTNRSPFNNNNNPHQTHNYILPQGKWNRMRTHTGSCINTILLLCQAHIHKSWGCGTEKRRRNSIICVWILTSSF